MSRLTLRTCPQLDVIADHLIRRAVGDDPQAIAETRRQLEAGIDPSGWET